MKSLQTDYKVLFILISLIAAVAGNAQGKTEEFKDLPSEIPILGTDHKLMNTKKEVLDKFMKDMSCTFADNQYNLRSKIPVFGTNHNWMNMNTEVLDKFMKDLKRISESVMSTCIQNDWDPLIKFIKDFKDQKSGKTLSAFYDDYHVEFTPNRGSAGAVIQIYKQIKTIYKDLHKYFYLVTVDRDLDFPTINPSCPLKSMFKKLMAQYSRDVPMTWRYEHIAGALKIIVDGRYGCIIVNPGVGLSGPVLLMDDKKHPHTAIIPGGFKREFRFYRIQNSNHVLALEYKLTKSSIPTKKHMYFLGKPFCSFLDTTIKRHLLFPKQEIIRRQSNGAPSGYLSFKLMPLDHGTSKYYHFTLGYVNEQQEEKEWYIPVNSPTEISEGSKTEPIGRETLERLRIEEVCNRMLISTNGTINKMNTIREILFHDENLTRSIFDLRTLTWIVIGQRSSKTK